MLRYYFAPCHCLPLQERACRRYFDATRVSRLMFFSDTPIRCRYATIIFHDAAAIFLRHAYCRYCLPDTRLFAAIDAASFSCDYAHFATTLIADYMPGDADTPDTCFFIVTMLIAATRVYATAIIFLRHYYADICCCFACYFLRDSDESRGHVRHDVTTSTRHAATTVAMR